MDNIYAWKHVHSQTPPEKESYFGHVRRKSSVQNYQEISQEVIEMPNTKEKADTKKMADSHQPPNDTDATRQSNVPNCQLISQEAKEMADTKNVADTHQPPNDTDDTKPELPKSQFLRKVEKISVFHNVWIALLARHRLIKEKHPIFKATIEFGEKTAYWIEQNVEYVVTATKMEGSLKKLDTVALNCVVKLEDAENNVRSRFLNASKMVRFRIEDTTVKVNKGREWVRRMVYKPTHAMLDFVENKCEAVMLTKSSEKSTLSNEAGFVNTVRRLIDVTYRFNFGVLSVAGQKAREVTEKKDWALQQTSWSKTITM